MGVTAVKSGLDLIDLSLDEVLPNPKQPRKVFDEDELRSLADSIRTLGVLQPVVVLPGGPPYVLLVGERRVRAARQAGLSSIPAVVRATDPGDELLALVAENLNRAQLNPLEEAQAYQALLAEGTLTQEQLAVRLGRSRQHVGSYLSLLRLPVAVQRRVAAGVIPYGHARVLATIRDPWVCERMAERVVAEGLSSRSLEEQVYLGDLPGWEDEREREEKKRPRAAPSVVAPEVAESVVSALEDALETKVKVTGTARRGRIVIEHAGTDDLLRIAQALGLPLPALTPWASSLESPETLDLNDLTDRAPEPSDIWASDR